MMTTAFRSTRYLAAAGAVFLLLGSAACASSWRGVDGDVSLGPGGSVTGTVRMPPRVETRLEFENEGNGPAEIRIETFAGEVLQEGPLGEALRRHSISAVAR